MPERAPPPEHPPLDLFEPRPGFDVDTTLIRRLGYLLAAIVVAILLSMIAWRRFGSTRPDPGAPVAIVPGAPGLETVPTADRAAYDRDQQRRLTTTGWVDRRHGIVHIPIDRAIELTIERAQRPAAETPR